MLKSPITRSQARRLKKSTDALVYSEPGPNQSTIRSETKPTIFVFSLWSSLSLWSCSKFMCFLSRFLQSFRGFQLLFLLHKLLYCFRSIYPLLFIKISLSLWIICSSIRHRLLKRSFSISIVFFGKHSPFSWPLIHLYKLWSFHRLQLKNHPHLDFYPLFHLTDRLSTIIRNKIHQTIDQTSVQPSKNPGQTNPSQSRVHQFVNILIVKLHVRFSKGYLHI